MTLDTYIKKFLRDKYVFASIIASIVFMSLGYAFAYVNLFPLEKNIVLHINITNSIDLFANYGDIISILVGFFVVFVVNIFLACLLYTKDKSLSYIILFSTIWISVVCSVVFYLIGLMN